MDDTNSMTDTMAKWIWLDPARHPDVQETYATTFCDRSGYTFCVAEFQKTFVLEENAVSPECDVPANDDVPKKGTGALETGTLENSMLSGQDKCGVTTDVIALEGIMSAKLTVSADTRYRLWVNGRFIGTGPVAPGGDYGNQKPMPNWYATEYTVPLQKGENRIFAQVQLGGLAMTEYSAGRGGFWLACTDVSESGASVLNQTGLQSDGERPGSKRVSIHTDKTWQARLCNACRPDKSVDMTAPEAGWEQAVETGDSRMLRLSPLPPLCEQFVAPSEVFVFPQYRQRVQAQGDSITVQPGCPLTLYLKFDKIYSGYVSFGYQGTKNVKITLSIQEQIGKTHETERIVASESFSYRGLRMQSIGCIGVTLEGFSGKPVTLTDPGLIFSCYPAPEEGTFDCSDRALNQIYEVGKWTLAICRQSLHLDSPLHQETLGCTGDYFIESLMGYYCFSDTRLTRLDIVRTADFLRMNQGVMFHTSYSLIWVQMVAEYCRYTADFSVLDEVMDALDILLERFDSYIGENGLIENPPNYMFVDWVEVDGYTLHHPPKCLGQACLNAFYYKALTDAVYLCSLCCGKVEKSQGTAVLCPEVEGCRRKTLALCRRAEDHCDNKAQAYRQGIEECCNRAQIYRRRAEAVKKGFAAFYDTGRGLYFDGLDTPGQENAWQPANPNRRYFSQHTNSLAVLYGLAGDAMRTPVMEQVMADDSLIAAQPYFLHFVLDALDAAGLFEKYGLAQIRRWTRLVEEFPGGMKEIWDGSCDYSHAWGATPVYQLPSRLLGLTIVEPGFKRITLRPRTCGLAYAHIKVPTPFGIIDAVLHGDGQHSITVPDGIKYEIL